MIEFRYLHLMRAQFIEPILSANKKADILVESL